MNEIICTHTSPGKTQKTEVTNIDLQGKLCSSSLFHFILISFLWPIHVIICLEGKTSLSRESRSSVFSCYVHLLAL